jgi:hypothetical protein
MGRLANLALAHLLVRIRPLHRALHRAVARREATTQRLAAAGARPDAISLPHVLAELADLDDLSQRIGFSTGPAELTDDERAVEADLRGRGQLPLDILTAELGLDDFEQEAIVLCAAVELDVGFATAYAFVVDEREPGPPSVELVAGLTARSLLERTERRSALGAFGALRRHGVLLHRDRDGRASLALSPYASAFLLGGDGDAADLFRDPDDVRGEPPAMLLGVDGEHMDVLAGGLERGTLRAIGAFGGRVGDRRDVALALADRLGVPLRRVASADALACAGVLGALGWIDVERDPPDELVEQLAASRVPIVLTAARPWRATPLLEAGGYAELAIARPSASARSAAWQSALPELDDDRANDLAARLRFNGPEIRAAAAIARTSSRLLTNGEIVTPEDCVDDACAIVSRPSSLRYATLIEPRRTRVDLVLSPELHARVLDIAAFYRARTHVSEGWNFASRLTGGGGIKALFAGDSGTGKTLAAEVIAGELGLPLLKVDLAQVVSKWVGETEKNLEAVFAEAEACQAVLFFDEAEALFGSRAEIRQATDRYANLEVSFLLQRLDDFAGLVVLATNLRDKIDAAFTRRFHVVIAFPRPHEKERRKIWDRVFPPGMPIGELDTAALARLDLTGAGITSAAETAALLAARDGAPAVTMSYVVRAIARQYQREARILNPKELGAHAPLIAEPS